MNEAVCVVEYMEDGSSKNMFRQYYKNPRGFSFMRKVHMVYDKKFINKFKNCIHYVSGSLIIKNRKFLVESPKKFMTLLAYPFGCILYLIILRKNRQGEI